MPTHKTWTIGEVLTAGDLNTAFTPLPLYAAAITAQYTAGAIAANGTASVAIALPVSRFTVAPIVTLTTTDSVLTPFVSAVTSGTVTVGLRNNGSVSSGGTVTITGWAFQFTSGTAAG